MDTNGHESWCSNRPEQSGPGPFRAAVFVSIRVQSWLNAGLAVCWAALAPLSAETAEPRPTLTPERSNHWLIIHGPHIPGGLMPVESIPIRGRIYIAPNDIPALLKRYEQDFPEHVGKSPMSKDP
jgi:hypothetical protein